MTFNSRKIFLLIICSLLFAGLIYNNYRNKIIVAPELMVTHIIASGGETTVDDKSSEAFSRPAANLSVQELRDFTFGNKIFNTNWLQFPASVKSLDGLGPLFNRVSCSACHFKDGRGRPPVEGEEYLESMLVRLSIKGKDKNGGPLEEPTYGVQLNELAINGVLPEGKTKISYEEIGGTYADGTSYQLRKPHYQFVNLNYGNFHRDMEFSPRVAPFVFGLGLLEAIPDATILAMSDPDDHNGDGISGRPNYVYDIEKKKRVIGRFGWKANVATIMQQDANAALGDIGITTNLHKVQNCTSRQTSCNKAKHSSDVEMSDFQLEKLTFYSQTLAPPARRNIDDSQVKKGEKLFSNIGCAACHRPNLNTGNNHPVAALNNQKIHPFTDLLLHDMGEGLADNRADYEATGREWRTPPLWGIGLLETVNRHSFLLHDGRARNFAEAILWHGGEAEKSKEEFRNMKEGDRKALIKFLNSL